MGSHFAMEYLGAAWLQLWPVIATLALIWASLRWSLRRPPRSDWTWSWRTATVGLLWTVWTSFGGALLVCWALGRGFTDIFGTDPLPQTPGESLAYALLCGMLLGVCIAGIALFAAGVMVDVAWATLLMLGHAIVALRTRQPLRS